MSLFNRRPDRELWKPLANADPDYEVDCYRAAAGKLGIQIEVSYPIPSGAAGFCAGLGWKGIYIKRSQAERESELLDGYFKEKERAES